MRYAIKVSGADSSNSRWAIAAYQFIKAAVAEGHEVNCVFFYGDGVYHGFDQPQAALDSRGIDWPGLAAGSGIELTLCSAGVERRSIAGGESLQSLIRPGFRIGGLGVWIDACLRADRVVAFGG